MKMAMEVADTIGELHPILNLITLIINKASTARSNNRVCRKFAQWLETIEGLLKPLLKIPKLMEHPETSRPLKHLEESLQQAYDLVDKYKDRSYPYRFIMGSDIIERFRDARNEIKDIIDLVPLIRLFVSETIHRVDTGCEYEEEEDRNKGNKEQIDQKEKGRGRENEKDTQKGKNMETKGKEENEKVKEKDIGKKKDTENEDEEEQKVKDKDTENENEEEHHDTKKEKEKERDMKKEMNEEWKENEREDEKGKAEKKKNMFPLVKTAMLKVAMHCQCTGCPDGIKRSIRKYPGVKNVATEMDERILSVTVVGDFDAKMLRDFVAKKTKKEVDLVGDGERERDDHQVLEKTGKDSKNIGGGKLVGGNKNKKRVVPMIPETVVLKVGGTGLRCGCNGCVDKICNRLFKIRGVQQVGVDMDQNQVTVTGTSMDTAILLETLGKNGRRPVEVVRSGMMDGKD